MYVLKQAEFGNRNVRGYHVHQDSWDATFGEQLPQCKREPENRKDLFDRRGSGKTICHVPKSVCSMCLLCGGTIHCRVIASRRY